MFSNEPSAAVIVVVAATLAEKSLPLPTVNGRWPDAGPYGCSGGATHATFLHATRGNAALKQPRPGVRSLAMSLCHAAWVSAFLGGGGAADAVAGAPAHAM